MWLDMNVIRPYIKENKAYIWNWIQMKYYCSQKNIKIEFQVNVLLEQQGYEYARIGQHCYM